MHIDTTYKMHSYLFDNAHTYCNDKKVYSLFFRVELDVGALVGGLLGGCVVAGVVVTVIIVLSVCVLVVIASAAFSVVSIAVEENLYQLQNTVSRG